MSHNQRVRSERQLPLHPDYPPGVSVRNSVLRRRCERRLRHLPIPDPFVLEILCERLAQSRGRPLTLHAMPPLGLHSPNGVWVATASADHIFVDEGARALHREHIVLHEIGHMVAEHNSGSVLSPADTEALLPDLDRAMVARVLGRTRYSLEEEREAELMATLIAQRAGRPTMPDADPELEALRSRLRSVLG